MPMQIILPSESVVKTYSSAGICFTFLTVMIKKVTSLFPATECLPVASSQEGPRAWGKPLSRFIWEEMNSEMISNPGLLKAKAEVE